MKLIRVMSDNPNTNDELFDGGPLQRWERSLGLVKPGRRLIARRALFAVLGSWLPLMILAAVQFLFSSRLSAKSLFSDFAVHARFLLAVPALILADAECIPRLGRIVNHFVEAGLIIEPDRPRFEAAVSSTRWLLNSTIAEAATVVLVYLGVAALVFYFSDAMPAWHRRESAGVFRFSAPGWWHVLVSLPLLLVLFFRWLWRLVLWTRFLFLMSLLDLRLVAAHPDNVGGLKFVSSSLRGFRLISFALGAVVAGSIADRQIHQGSQPLDFKNLAIGLIVFLIILFAGPLTIFFKKLRETKRRGVFEYGALAGTLGRQFETRWLGPGSSVDQTSLDAQDFSATTDLYSIAANVYAMREAPFTLKNLIGPIAVSAMLPFIPLALLAMPLEIILRGLVKLLF